MHIKQAKIAKDKLIKSMNNDEFKDCHPFSASIVFHEKKLALQLILGKPGKNRIWLNEYEGFPLLVKVKECSY